MNGPRDEGLLARLRANETLRRLTGGRPDIAIFGAPVAIIAVVAIVAGIVLATGGGGGNEQARAETPTAGVSDDASPTPASAGLKTPIAISPGDELTAQDLAARGTGEPARGDFTGDRLIIPKIGVDAPFSYKVVPGNGVMPNPNSWDDVAYYDFSSWPGMGGLPGKGGNVVLAGHVDYIRHGPAVFWDLHKLERGDRVQIRLKDGSTVEYEVMFNKFVSEDAGNFNQIVSATADESVTLITCSGDFVNGHYNQRQIVWARRV
ncbi:MAG TPA: class F sortase [Dehalococcoidia bacterium]|nr:class F sortase [Dehalococcoidia bacterium]